MKYIFIALIFASLLSCSKEDGTVDIVTPVTLQETMNNLGLSYNVYYDYAHINGSDAIGKIKIQSDTVIVESYQGKDYSFRYSYSSNNKPENPMASFTAKDVIPINTPAPITKMASHQYFHLSRQNGFVCFSGKSSYTASTTSYKIIFR